MTQSSELPKNSPKILIYDIETTYTVGASFGGLYEVNIAKVLRYPYMLTVAWKWLGEDKTHVISLRDFPLYKKDKRSDKSLAQFVRDELFDKADVIVAHNGNAFDQKWVFSRFFVHGIQPPSPSKYVDTKVVAKSKFKLISNKLEQIATMLGIGHKLKTDIDLWVDIVEDDCDAAWKMMCKYNKMDVDLLEKVYLKMRPFMTNHPNMGMLSGEAMVCHACGGNHMQRRGFQRSNTALYQRYQCQDCGIWDRARTAEKGIKPDLIAIV